MVPLPILSNNFFCYGKGKIVLIVWNGRNGQPLRLPSPIPPNNQRPRRRRRNHLPLHRPRRNPNRTILLPEPILGAPHAHLPPNPHSRIINGGVYIRVVCGWS